jgi:hypothetical protein
MLSRILRNQLDKFSHRYNYDASYMEYILEHDGGAFFKFGLAQGIGRHTGALPLDVHFAAVIRSAINEDCGPCVQLVVDMALEAGVGDQLVSAIVVGQLDELPEDLALATNFANAVIARDPAAEDMRPALLERWGEKGLIEFGLALTSAKLYPDLKYTLGFGQACSRVMVGEQVLAGASL